MITRHLDETYLILKEDPKTYNIESKVTWRLFGILIYKSTQTVINDMQVLEGKKTTPGFKIFHHESTDTKTK